MAGCWLWRVVFVGVGACWVWVRGVVVVFSSARSAWVGGPVSGWSGGEADAADGVEGGGVLGGPGPGGEVCLTLRDRLAVCSDRMLGFRAGVCW